MQNGRVERPRTLAEARQQQLDALDRRIAEEPNSKRNSVRQEQAARLRGLLFGTGRPATVERIRPGIKVIREPQR